MNRTGVLLFLSLLIFNIHCAQKGEDFAMVIFFVGDVKINGAVAEIGNIVKENDTIITGTMSSCDIKIGESIIRVKEKSKLLISQLIKTGAVENVALGLDVGKMLCKPKKLMKSESFMVRTPTAVAAVRGTQFTVETDRKKTTRIKVYNGKVRVARRVKQLEEKIDTILDEAPPLVEKEKVVITEKEVRTVEKKIDRVLARESGKDLEAAVARIVNEVKDEVIVTRKSVDTFKVEDFTKENREIIAIQEKPNEIMRKIARVVKLEKEKPKPDGRLLVTRYEVYFIKNGRVVWDGVVINPPVREEGKLYIASGDYVFCASIDGPVLWRKRIENNGKLALKGESLMVYSKGKVAKLDKETGEE